MFVVIDNPENTFIVLKFNVKIAMSSVFSGLNLIKHF